MRGNIQQTKEGPGFTIGLIYFSVLQLFAEFRRLTCINLTSRLQENLDKFVDKFIDALQIRKAHKDIQNELADFSKSKVIIQGLSFI